MAAPTLTTIAASALAAGLDNPLDHTGMMDWCQHSILDFANLDQTEQHSLASQLQVKVALLHKGVEHGSPNTSSDRLAAVVSSTFTDMACVTLSTYPQHAAVNQDAVLHWAKVHVSGMGDSKKRACRRLLEPVIAQLKQRESPDSESDEQDEEGGVDLDSNIDYALLPGPIEAQNELSEAGKKKEKKKKTKTKGKAPIVNHVAEPTADIAARITQEGLDLQRPLVVNAWCMLNVPGFAESHMQCRKEIIGSVTQHLVSAGYMSEGTTEGSEAIETPAEKKKRKQKATWFKLVKESNSSIAARFPWREVDFSVLRTVNAWCVLHVEGFAESGHIARHQIPIAVQEMLEAKHGASENAE